MELEVSGLNERGGVEDIMELDSEDENQPYNEGRGWNNPNDDDDDDEDGGRNNPEEEAIEMPPRAGGDSEGGEATDPAAIKPKRIVRNPQPKLDALRLMGPRGVPSIQRIFKGVKWRGKGYEREDLKELLRQLQHWGHRLFPALPFSDFLAQVEKLGKKKNVKVNIKRLRLDMFVESEVEGGTKDEVKRWGDEEAEPEPIVDVFDELLGTVDNPPVITTPLPVPSQTSVGLSEEQRERLERNRRLAAERRIARQHQQQEEDQAREEALREEEEERQREEERDHDLPVEDAFDALRSRDQQTERNKEKDLQDGDKGRGNTETMDVDEEPVKIRSHPGGRKRTIEDTEGEDEDGQISPSKKFEELAKPQSHHLGRKRIVEDTDSEGEREDWQISPSMKSKRLDSVGTVMDDNVEEEPDKSNNSGKKHAAEDTDLENVESEYRQVEVTEKSGRTDTSRIDANDDAVFEDNRESVTDEQVTPSKRSQGTDNLGIDVDVGDVEDNRESIRDVHLLSSVSAMNDVTATNTAESRSVGKGRVGSEESSGIGENGDISTENKGLENGNIGSDTHIQPECGENEKNGATGIGMEAQTSENKRQSETSKKHTLSSSQSSNAEKTNATTDEVLEKQNDAEKNMGKEEKREENKVQEMGRNDEASKKSEHRIEDGMEEISTEDLLKMLED